MLLAPSLVACTSDSSTGLPANLPAGWEDAERITGFVQFACGGSPYEPYDERADIRGTEGAVLVEYREAHFRCVQPVEGFYRVGEGTLDLLVQPVDMSPEGVAGCDCLYDIFMIVTELEEREYQVGLYRRWDDWNDPNDPVLIATETIGATE